MKLVSRHQKFAAVFVGLLASFTTKLGKPTYQLTTKERVIRPIFVRKAFPFQGLKTLTLIILAIVLIVCDHRSTSFVPVRKVLSAVAAPIQYAVDWPVQVVVAIQDNFRFKQTLLAQNAELNAQLLIAQAQLQKSLALEKENLELRNLLQSANEHNEKVLIARILAVDSDAFIDEVVIDKGTPEGIFVGQPVLDASGIFGQVVQVGPLTSRVMLLTDPRSGIPIQVLRNGLRAIAIGNGETDRLLLPNLSVTSDIKVGDELVSSNLGERFPQGYPAATVTSVKTPPGSSFLIVSAKPTANLDGANLLLLLWPHNSIKP